MDKDSHTFGNGILNFPPIRRGKYIFRMDRKEKIGSGKYHFSVDIPTRNAAILSDEFLYENASFPECHGATIVELKNGDLVASFLRRNKRAQSGLLASGYVVKPKGSK